MKKNLVTLEISKLLKELGFDEECIFYYILDKEKDNLAIIAQFASLDFNLITNNTAIKTSYDSEGNHLQKSVKLNFVVAPYWSQVIDWLIEKHELSIEILSCFNEESESTYYEGWVIGDFSEEELSEGVDIYFTHYQARERTILEALNYLKLRQNENKN